MAVSTAKILWIVNVPLPEASLLMGENPTPYGGWLINASQNLSELRNIELTIAFPHKRKASTEPLIGNGITYYSFNPVNDNENITLKSTDELKNIITSVNPDLVHIFGTELPHSLAIVNICESLQIKFVLSIQGLVSIIADHLLSDLPWKTVYGYTIRNILLKDSFINLKKLYIRRGRKEVDCIRKAKNVVGRTTWDKACVHNLNKNINYHHCNETLRPSFYENQWNYEKCEPYSLFVSQAQLPLKGLHIVLKAMSLIIHQFPNTKLYIGGKNIVKATTIKDKLLMTYYGRYIERLIIKENLTDNVFFLNELSEKEMCQRLIKSNAFISSSSIENSPNSLAEAMLLGVPCVASYVGGVPDMITHGEEGYLYHSSAYYMLAYYVCEIFKSKELSLYLSKNARKRALVTHDPEINNKRLVEIYSEIL